MVVERTLTVRHRIVNTTQVLVHIDQDSNVHHTTRRWKRNGEFVDYNHLPSLRAKRWWGMYIAEVHPKDRGELHTFLGLGPRQSNPTKESK